MNIKSLLLGSAAALVAVSGARAADAVMAEPEAVEYVRVCDAYGAGFFYIPGTETCLKIGGIVRYQVDFKNGDKGWRKQSYFELGFDARNDTELGTLRSFLQLKGGTVTTNPVAAVPAVVGPPPVAAIPGVAGGVGGGTVTINKAFITLGGLKMGYDDTVYDGGLDGEGSAGGGASVNQVGYTFSGGSGFTATLSLEEETTNLNYIPNVVGKVSFTQGWGGVDAWVAFDDKDIAAFDKSGWSVKGRLTANVGSAGVLKVLATYNGGGLTNPTGGAHSNMYANGGRWTLGASYKQTINPKLAITGVVQYQADTNYELATSPNNFTFGGVVDYTVVPGFLTKLAVWHKTNGAAPNTTEGFLRFERSF
jgi:hypothetical protein